MDSEETERELKFILDYYNFFGLLTKSSFPVAG